MKRVAKQPAQFLFIWPLTIWRSRQIPM